jgi:CheY-like chemotaxis protein
MGEILIRKILLVDDEADIRTISRLSLSNIGKWAVVEAKSGLDAVEVAAREAPDLILLDVMMPGMNGPTTFGKLREQPSTQTIPIIFMTAKVQKHEIDELLALGATGIIRKPFDPMKLADEIRQIVGA